MKELTLQRNGCEASFRYFHYANKIEIIISPDGFCDAACRPIFQMRKEDIEKMLAWFQEEKPETLSAEEAKRKFRSTMQEITTMQESIRERLAKIGESDNKRRR